MLAVYRIIKNRRGKILKFIAYCYHHLTDMLAEFSQIPIFHSLVKCHYV